MEVSKENIFSEPKATPREWFLAVCKKSGKMENIMHVEKTTIEGPLIITPSVHGDDRGFFVENYQDERYRDILGVEHIFVQDNLSRSQKGVLRGLHYQKEPHAQGKLISVLHGKVFDVAVDVRPKSKTFGQWVSVYLEAPKYTDIGWTWEQFWIPPGFAHGFLALEDDTLFTYKCTDFYAPEHDAGLAWDDNLINITWPDIGMHPLVSKKDMVHDSINTIK